MNTDLRETLAAFSEKLGFLMGSGVPLVQALETIMAESGDSALHDCLRHVIRRIGEGGRFCEAFNDFPQLFSPSFLGMIRSGESQGILDHMMEKIARGLREGLIPVGGHGEVGEDPTRPDASAALAALLEEAVRARATDLHLTPMHDGLLAQLRVAGGLVEAKRFPGPLKDPVITRAKFLAGLDLGEKHLPQDGRIVSTIAEERVDIRVNLLPVALGEKITMRFVHHGDLRWKPEDIFSDPADLADFRTLLESHFGLIVMTGTSGSGKTTTAYSALMELRDKGEGAIATIEFPVGVILDGMAQIPVRPHLGLGYGEALNAIMRGDPDVIFVDDVQDADILAKVLKCALTGHLVLFNLPVANVTEVLRRLLDLKAPPHLLASALSGVTAQRLVRKVCPTCSAEAKIPAAALKTLGWKGKKIAAREGKGCEHCNHSGFRGRVALYEMLVPDKAFKDSLQSGDMKQVAPAVRAAMRRTLAQAGAELVATGVTTLSELERVLRDIPSAD